MKNYILSILILLNFSCTKNDGFTFPVENLYGEWKDVNVHKQLDQNGKIVTYDSIIYTIKNSNLYNISGDFILGVPNGEGKYVYDEMNSSIQFFPNTSNLDSTIYGSPKYTWRILILNSDTLRVEYNFFRPQVDSLQQIDISYERVFVKI